MSSILKALKKLEDEKVARRPDDLNIDSEILRSDNSPRFSGTVVVLSALLLLAGGSAATYIYIYSEKPSEIANLKSPIIIKQNQPPLKPDPIIITEPILNSVPATEKKEEITTKVESSVKKQASLITKTPSTAPPVVVTTRPTVKTSSGLKPVVPEKSVVQSKPVIPPKPVIPTTTSADKSIPALRVNGIAHQKNSSESMAIINGTPLSKGSVIEGVTIEEIHKDRVLFQRNGEKFEIPLGQSNR